MADAKKGSMLSKMKERARNRAQERKFGGGGFGQKFTNIPNGTSFFKPKKGTHSIDVIPYRITVDNHPIGASKGEEWYQRTIYVHYNVGPEEKTYLCRKTIDQRCPICEHAAKLRKKVREEDEEIINALKPKERELYNVIDLDNPDEGIQLFEMSYFLFGKLLETEMNEGADDYVGFADPVNGYTLRIRFTEKTMGQGNPFLETSRIDFIERKKPYKMEIIDKAVDLDRILNVLSYEELEAIFTGAESPRSSSNRQEEEEEKPRTPRTEESSNKREKQREENKDDSNDENDDDDEHNNKAAKSEKEQEKPRDTPKSTKNEDSDSLECPIEKGAFGIKTDDLDGCESCDLWEKCIEKKEKS